MRAREPGHPHGPAVSVADAQHPPTTEPAVTSAPPADPPSRTRRPTSVAHAAPWALPVRRPALRRDGLSQDAGHLIAVGYALAWILCPVVEPVPDHDMAYPLWQLPIDLAASVTIVAAVRALWRGSRHSARLGMAAGVLMAVETVTCTIAGHTPVGWWTWVQTALSLLVMGVSVVLLRFRPAAG